MTSPRTSPTSSARTVLGVAALSAATAFLVAGCASAPERTDDTLPPLGGPTTLALPGFTTTIASGAVDSSSTVVSTIADPSSTTLPTSTTAAAATGDWGGWAYYEVPQLGSEPVRGSGCGANGGLGETVPDGVWNVNIGDGSGADRFWSNGSIQVDMRCVYAGDAGRAQWNAACSATPSADACQSQSPEWFVVNVNSRLRTMPVAADAQYGVGALGSSPCPGASTDRTARDAPWRFMDSWVVVKGGIVTTVIAACPAG